jgi:hypothetical protein
MRTLLPSRAHSLSLHIGPRRPLSSSPCRALSELLCTHISGPRLIPYTCFPESDIQGDLETLTSCSQDLSTAPVRPIKSVPAHGAYIQSRDQHPRTFSAQPMSFQWLDVEEAPFNPATQSQDIAKPMTTGRYCYRSLRDMIDVYSSHHFLRRPMATTSLWANHDAKASHLHCHQRISISITHPSISRYLSIKNQTPSPTIRYYLPYPHSVRRQRRLC